MASVSSVSCATCPSDCGICASGCGGGLACGDGVCEAGEDCACCAKDCGQCPKDGYCGIKSARSTRTASPAPATVETLPERPPRSTLRAAQPGQGCADFGCSQCVCDGCPSAVVSAWIQARSLRLERCLARSLATGQCALSCPCVDTSCGDAFCGDAVCQLGEQASCPEDCGDGDGDSCGNSLCESPKENCSNCPQDCQPCSVDFCGNFSCGPAEDCQNCPEDCGDSPFPDGSCDVGDGGLCGDSLCSDGETCSSCPLDCGDCPSFCGDNACVGAETCETCEGDCGSCTSDTCNNDQCELGEDCANCPEDCGICDLDDSCWRWRLRRWRGLQDLRTGLRPLPLR